MSKLKVLDLFSGIGGFSLGLESAGDFETVAFCEIDKHCHKVLYKHWPEIPIYEDVSNLDLISLQHAGIAKIDVICGGFPCTDISVAGKQKGLIDENGNKTRSGLWFEYKRLIGEIKPNYVIIENVAALRGNGLVTVLQDLWKIGYDAEWHIISARSVGACHLRERIWIIAYPNGNTVWNEQQRFKVGWDDISPSRKTVTGDNGQNGDTFTANTDDLRLWRPFTSEEEKLQWWAETTACFRDRWQTESDICRMDDGIQRELDTPERVRKQRIKQLGNSIVPQIAELIGRKILEYENPYLKL